MNVAVQDVDRAEHNVVESPPHRRARLAVGLVAVAGEADRHGEDLLPAGEVAFEIGELCLGRALRRGDAVLVLLEELEGDRVRVVRAQELLPLVGELGDLLGEHDAAL
ncbi:MAG: hypothetical protein HY775_08215 [Acidobacteria bacterium]|nr:hypothetical protein [Acidobacteriota bacterium]